MSYLDESGLFVYDSNLKEWISSQESKTITSSIYPWTKTAKAGAVSCYPVSGTELKPVVDFLFTETPPAEGDKGPENPSTITGVNKINLYRANKNILAVADFRATATIKNATWTNNGDGSISVTRNSAGDGTSFYDIKGLYNALEYFPAGTYTFTRGGEASNVRFGLSTADTAVVTILGSDVTKTFTLEEGMYLHFYAYLYQNNAASNVIIRPQLEFSPEASSYEIGISNTYQVSFGSTYYGGTLDVASGVMTVNVFRGVFNEPYTIVDVQTDETYICFQQARYGDPSHGSNADANLACNMFPTDGDGEKLFTRGNAGTNAVALRMLKSRLDVSGAANPSSPTSQEWIDAFTVWCNASNTIGYTYTLETPTTVQLSPTEILSLAQTDKYTPRLNTIYTDAQAVQVGYVKSPIREEFELQQAIVAQGGNI